MLIKFLIITGLLGGNFVYGFGLPGASNQAPDYKSAATLSASLRSSKPSPSQPQAIGALTGSTSNPTKQSSQTQTVYSANSNSSSSSQPIQAPVPVDVPPNPEPIKRQPPAPQTEPSPPINEPKPPIPIELPPGPAAPNPPSCGCSPKAGIYCLDQRPVGDRPSAYLC